MVSGVCATVADWAMAEEDRYKELIAGHRDGAGLVWSGPPTPEVINEIATRLSTCAWEMPHSTCAVKVQSQLLCTAMA